MKTMSPFITKDRHTLSSYLASYRAGKIGPLRYADSHVPVVPCRHCGQSRPDDGTPCKVCGAYKHCHNKLVAGNSPPPLAASPGKSVV